MLSPASPTHRDAGNSPAPWILPGSGLSVFYGRPEAPRLSHYFLPRVLLAGRRVLYVDGANRFDPLLLARMARRRGREPAEFYELVRVARAFTCFQLTELLARVPRFLDKFAAGALIVTGLPELYFDEDVREREAQVSFRRALVALHALRPRPLGVALFSDATSFHTPRRGMFRELTSQASHVWRFDLADGGKLRLLGEKAALPLPA
jgi:hypothetical protein